MLEGQTAEKDGHQIALFPLDYCRVTQMWGAATYSHCCSYATDWGFPHTHYPVFAPCDCHLIYSDAESVGNTRCYQSDDEVWTPQGLQYICFLFTHDNTPPAQTSFHQGDVIAHSGTAGHALGEHIHIECAPGAGKTLVNSGMVCESGVCWKIMDGCPPNEIFYMTGGETIENLGGMEFEDAENVKDPSIPAWMMAGIIKKRRLLGYAKRKRSRILRSNK